MHILRLFLGFLGPRQWTCDDRDRSFQVNYLSPFLLTTELGDRVHRVVNVSSDAIDLCSIGDVKTEINRNKFNV